MMISDMLCCSFEVSPECGKLKGPGLSQSAPPDHMLSTQVLCNVEDSTKDDSPGSTAEQAAGLQE